MTNDELSAIEARAHAATAGPWHVARLNVDDSGAEFAGDCVETECEPGDEQLWVEVRDGTPGHVAITCDEEGATTAPVAEFIAAARTDVPALCAELRTTRERLATAEALLRRIRDVHTDNDQDDTAITAYFAAAPDAQGDNT